LFEDKDILSAGIEFSALLFLCQSLKAIPMNNSAPVKQLKDITVRPLAPVISLKAVVKEESKPKRKVPDRKLDNNQPQIYNKPIYRPRKYDLL
jgi:hypothetical protein